MRNLIGAFLLLSGLALSLGGCSTEPAAPPRKDPGFSNGNIPALGHMKARG